MKIIILIGTIAVGILFFFAIIFAMAASSSQAGQSALSRFAVSGIFFIAGIAVIAGVYYTTRKPKTVIHQVEVSGQMKAAKISCPNCSAPIDANQIKIMSGVPYVTCPYCGNTFEVTEEPKW